MKRKIKFAISMIAVFIIVFSAFISSAAAVNNEAAVAKFYSYEQKLLCISHRGDTAFYPENSFEAIDSAFKKGADFVSVSLDKTKDGIFYLCERESLGNICNAPYDTLSEISSEELIKYSLFDIYGNETHYRPVSLVELLKNTDLNDGIIFDVCSEDKDAVYDILLKYNALERSVMRIDESSKKLIKWADSKPEKVNIIPIYNGNIIFSTISEMKKITNADMTALQYKSKNYFNVAYGSFFTDRYLTTANARAVAATYSPDLCGQRGDGADGWNELIRKGFSVIETNNIDSFVGYRKEAERLSAEISELIKKANYIDSDKYSDVSISNLNRAKLNGEALISGIIFSLDEAQQAYSNLLYALEDMKISTGEVDTRGALNITAGKVVAAILVGAALLAGQIYVYKMRKKSKEK